MSCARPSCGNVVWVDDLCTPCARAEARAIYNIEFDHLARMDEYYPEHRARHDRPKKVTIRPYISKPEADVFGTRYGRVSMANILERMRERPDRNNALFEASCQVGSLAASGELDGADAMLQLAEAAEFYCPDERLKARGTITRGVKTGMREPRRAA
jgi:hypothetical protein